ncbi:unnamed protein product [Polarella glacialis]|uniref:ABC transporter domain-containing protein n=1 Tax=Polarella glacialis TaxID=89957 RepID=A0A813LYG7_POLGL|nr:unnamed protein product [Polarella glacialis]CAE8741516.1 unnamed protein product [Polarella glacialis]
MAGIWPDASVEIFFPQGTLFLPQKSYIPQGSLKQAVAYPGCADDYSDEQVTDALRAVKLTACQGRDLSEKADWAMLLSGGEQQKLAVALALLRMPLLLLDEATSAMGAEAALDMFALLRKPGSLAEGAAVTSVSHDIDLMKFRGNLMVSAKGYQQFTVCFAIVVC